MTGVEMLAAFVGAGGLAAIIGFVKWMVDRSDRLKKESEDEEEDIKRIPAMFDAFSKLYSGMRELIDYPGCTRVILLKASDSGRIPRIGIPLFVTVIAEVFSDGYKSIRSNWFNRPVDDQYIQMLVELVANEKTIIHQQELRPDDVLYDTYDLAGTAHSDIRLVLADESEMYYLSIHHSKEVPLDAAYREQVLMLVSKTRAILEKELEAVKLDGKEDLEE